jgi:hypothetical protein
VSARVRRVRHRFGPWFVLAVVVASLDGCGPGQPPQATCSQEEQLVEGDDMVRGHLAFDLVSPYFGTFTGEVAWSEGRAAMFSLSVAEFSGQSLRLSQVWDCRPHAIGGLVTARFVTDDGVFTHSMLGNVTSSFPEDPPGTTVGTGMSLGAISDVEWSPALAARLPIDTSRYDSSHLIIELDWPPRSSPQGGRIVFHGTVAGTELKDRIVVATLTF